MEKYFIYFQLLSALISLIYFIHISFLKLKKNSSISNGVFHRVSHNKKTRKSESKSNRNFDLDLTYNFVPENNRKMKNKNDNPNKLIIAKKSK